MTTLYGGPMPPDFTDGEQLTAAGFNAVKNYWVIDGELPEDAEDGDVVFAIGEALAVEMSCLVSVAGPQFLKLRVQTLKYEYTADGQDWSTFEWTDNGSVTMTDGIVDALIVAAGGSAGGPSN